MTPNACFLGYGGGYAVTPAIRATGDSEWPLTARKHASKRFYSSDRGVWLRPFAAGRAGLDVDIAEGADCEPRWD